MSRCRMLLALIAAVGLGRAAEPAVRRELTADGTRFLMNGKPFPYTGVSFFNAIYNPDFNTSSAERMKWLEKFRRYNINVLRVWCQWDSTRGFVDAAPENTLYTPDGQLRDTHLATLKAILADADRLGMVIELCLFSHESFGEGISLDRATALVAVTALTRELKPYRNLTFQIWNEHHDDNVLPLVRAVKEIDPARLVTSSCGFAGVLGTADLNEALDYLTPHTSRQGKGRHWELAPREIASLLKTFKKPVVDDEPARCGTNKYGGPKEKTYPADHMLQIAAVWQAGGYITYHHDMFQTGAGSPAVPPSGIPDPAFSPYHQAVFEFIALRDRYAPKTPSNKERP